MPVEMAAEGSNLIMIGEMDMAKGGAFECRSPAER